jgi:hypothetical protein
MISDQVIRVLIAGALLLHGIAHAIALAAVVGQTLRGPSASRVPIRSWLMSFLRPKTAAMLALPFWTFSTATFLAASASFWGILLPGLAWRQLALVGSAVSIAGVALFSGVWPGSPGARRSALNTAVALAMDLVILGTQLWLRWPPVTMFGK